VLQIIDRDDVHAAILRQPESDLVQIIDMIDDPNLNSVTEATFPISRE